jgi:hypothetical protein
MSGRTEATMADQERSYLLELWDKGVCPNCGKKIPECKRVGSGKKSDDGFCSLDCLAEYRSADFTAKHNKAMALGQRHRNS